MGSMGGQGSPVVPRVSLIPRHVGRVRHLRAPEVDVVELGRRCGVDVDKELEHLQPPRTRQILCAAFVQEIETGGQARAAADGGEVDRVALSFGEVENRSSSMNYIPPTQHQPEPINSKQEGFGAHRIRGRPRENAGISKVNDMSWSLVVWQE